MWRCMLWCQHCLWRCVVPPCLLRIMVRVHHIKSCWHKSVVNLPGASSMHVFEPSSLLCKHINIWVSLGCCMFTLTCIYVCMYSFYLGAAFLCALLFAVHPVHADAVASLVGRAELISACMFLCWYIYICMFSLYLRIYTCVCILKAYLRMYRRFEIILNFPKY